MGKANPPSSALKVSGQAIDTISWRATPNAPFAPCDHFRASSPVYASQTSKEGETYRQHHHATLLRAARRTPLRTPFQAHPSTSFTIDYIQVSVIPRRRRVTYPATALARVALGYCVPGGVHQSFALRQFRVSRAPLRFENLEGKLTPTDAHGWRHWSGPGGAGCPTGASRPVVGFDICESVQAESVRHSRTTEGRGPLWEALHVNHDPCAYRYSPRDGSKYGEGLIV